MLYIVKAISRRDFFDRRLKKGRGREITPIKVRLEAVSYQNFFQRQGVKRRRDSIFANLLLRTVRRRKKVGARNGRIDPIDAIIDAHNVKLAMTKDNIDLNDEFNKYLESMGLSE